MILCVGPITAKLSFYKNKLFRDKFKMYSEVVYYRVFFNVTRLEFRDKNNTSNYITYL